MSKVAVVGLNSSIYVFSILGIETFVVKSKVEAMSLLESLCKQDFGLILITKILYDQIQMAVNLNSSKFEVIIGQIPS